MSYVSTVSFSSQPAPRGARDAVPPRGVEPDPAGAADGGAGAAGAASAAGAAGVGAGAGRLASPRFTCSQLARLFGTTRAVASRHIGAVLAAGEVDPADAVRPAPAVRGGATYSLEVLCALGWRMGSSRGAAFRRWAARVIGRYLAAGHVEHRERLEQRGLAVRVLPRAAFALEGRGIGAIARAFAPALELLAAYDRGPLPCPSGNPCGAVLTPEACDGVVAELRALVAEPGFGAGPPDALHAVVAAASAPPAGPEGEPPTAEEQAARLLCGVIRKRPFADGNKRIACCLFLYTLDRNFLLFDGTTCRISPGALVALALLIDAAPPDATEAMVALTQRLLALGWV